MTAGSKPLCSLFVEWPSGKAPSRTWGHSVSVGGTPRLRVTAGFDSWLHECGHLGQGTAFPYSSLFPRTWNEVMPRSAWYDGTGSTHTLNQQVSTAAAVCKHPASYLARLKNVHFPHCEVCSNRKESRFPCWIWENQPTCIAGPTLCISVLRLLE